MTEKVLTRRQMQRIRKLADGKSTTRQISERIGLNYQIVYQFVQREKLQVKFLPGSRLEGRRPKENVFNVHAQNWI